MGDIKQGDQVFDQDGNVCNVTHVSEISNRKCFRLTFSDGSTIVSDDVHRWVTFTSNERDNLHKRSDEYRAKRRAKRPSRAKGNLSEAFVKARSKSNVAIGIKNRKPLPTGKMRDTQEIFDTFRSKRGANNHAIMLNKPLILPELDLHVPPYTLGAWLGDGTTISGGITGIDEQLFERIEADGFNLSKPPSSPMSRTILGLKPMLRAIGVLGNKHIPQYYMRSSEAQRLELLKGLLDSDGTCEKDGGCCFDNTNERLIDGVRELLSSLGIQSHKTSKLAKFNGKVTGTTYRVKFTTAKRVFHLDRKAERQNKKEASNLRFRYIIGCEEVESVPTKCISVDSETRQYLAGHQMIATHNTFLGLMMAVYKHWHTYIFRETLGQHAALLEIIKEVEPENVVGIPATYRPKRHKKAIAKKIQFAFLKHQNDLGKHQGMAKDFLWFDEAVHFTRSTITRLSGHLRPLKPDEFENSGLKEQLLLTFNPPLDATGLWVLDMFGPWINGTHPMYPTPYGQILYACMIDGEDFFFDSPDAITHHPKTGKKLREPQGLKSRTFFKATLDDNESLRNNKAYKATLQSLSEVERDAFLYGEMSASLVDRAGQIFKYKNWEKAKQRWPEKNELHKGTPPLCISIDPTGGGEDRFVMVPIWKGGHVGEPVSCKGSELVDGKAQAKYLEAYIMDTFHVPCDTIDVVYDSGGGYGNSLGEQWLEMYPDATMFRFLGTEKSNVNEIFGDMREDKPVGEISGMPWLSGKNGFTNKISAAWVRAGQMMEHELFEISVPPHQEMARQAQSRLIVERAANKISIEKKDDIIKKLGCSPDFADAMCMGLHYVSSIVAVRDMFD